MIQIIRNKISISFRELRVDKRIVGDNTTPDAGNHINDLWALPWSSGRRGFINGDRIWEGHATIHGDEVKEPIGLKYGVLGGHTAQDGRRILRIGGPPPAGIEFPRTAEAPGGCTGEEGKFGKGIVTGTIDINIFISIKDRYTEEDAFNRRDFIQPLYLDAGQPQGGQNRSRKRPSP